MDGVFGRDKVIRPLYLCLNGTAVTFYISFFGYYVCRIYCGEQVIDFKSYFRLISYWKRLYLATIIGCM